MSEKRQFIGLPPKLTKEQEEKLKNEAFNWLMNGGEYPRDPRQDHIGRVSVEKLFSMTKASKALDESYKKQTQGLGK